MIPNSFFSSDVLCGFRPPRSCLLYPRLTTHSRDLLGGSLMCLPTFLRLTDALRPEKKCIILIIKGLIDPDKEKITSAVIDAFEDPPEMKMKASDEFDKRVSSQTPRSLQSQSFQTANPSDRGGLSVTSYRSMQASPCLIQCPLLCLKV